MENNEVEPNAIRGLEWEVVSPTTSVYTAAPSTEQVEIDTNEDQADNMFRSLFMSGHFVFPPSQHENLPIEPETVEVDTPSDFMDESADPSEISLVSSGDQLPEHFKDDDEQNDAHEIPYNVGWKRRVVSLYTHAKDANAFWSVFVAAAVMGLVIIGQQWQKEKWQVLQLKWRFIIDEKMGKMLARPLSRLKEVTRPSHLADH